MVAAFFAAPYVVRGGEGQPKEHMVRSPRAGTKKPSSPPPVTSIAEMTRMVEQREAGGSHAASEGGGLEGKMLRRQQERSGRGEVEVYFGGGCFWHMQHAFVQAERKFLGRTDGFTDAAERKFLGRTDGQLTRSRAP
ncbi:hypothetical protein T484DRAFT_1858201 [Baffinella frigidus]|nr:hypothetical protein T484DRAFT_1858201 [Cryptophyta sp. CCMP2293]